MDCGAGKGVQGEEPCGEKHGRVFGTSFDTRRARVWYIFDTEYQTASDYETSGQAFYGGFIAKF